MFRCGSCGSGYSVQAALSWDSCPRCLSKEKVRVPLSFELGWRRQAGEVADAAAEQAARDSGPIGSPSADRALGR